MVEEKDRKRSEERSSLRTAGWLLFAFSTQFTIVMVVAESLYPGYSVSSNYISDLGLGKTGLLFDASIGVLGIAVLVSAYFLYGGFGSKIFSILVALAGAGALGVGLFNENSFPALHSISADTTFLAGPIAAIVAYRFTSSPMKYFSVVLGIVSLAIVVVFKTTSSGLGLGVGGTERMVVYPFLLWAIGFGGYLMGYSRKEQP